MSYFSRLAEYTEYSPLLIYIYRVSRMIPRSFYWGVLPGAGWVRFLGVSGLVPKRSLWFMFVVFLFVFFTLCLSPLFYMLPPLSFSSVYVSTSLGYVHDGRMYETFLNVVIKFCYFWFSQLFCEYQLIYPWTGTVITGNYVTSSLCRFWFLDWYSLGRHNNLCPMFTFLILT
jgi:hypothetical protein